MMKDANRFSYPRPAKLRAPSCEEPRPILPLFDPPTHLLNSPPTLPQEAALRQAESCAIDGYRNSTHIFPAAYPRQTPFVKIHDKILKHDASNNLDERRRSVQDVVEIFRETRLKYRQGGLNSPDLQEGYLLWNVVNRYYPKEKKPAGRKGVTLFLSHANGFHKEIWEPFLRRLVKRMTASGDIFIDEIWSLDVIQQGDSGLINADKLGMLFDWKDNARDFLNFFTRYLPDLSASSEENLPTYLARVPDSMTKSRTLSGFSDRELIVIGHSFSGTSSVMAALELPSLFSRIILVDPVISFPSVNRSHVLYNFLVNTMLRRQSWASREEARKLLGKSPFFAAWDPEVLDAYVQYGTTPMGDSRGVRLKLTAIQENSVFNDVFNSYETFQRLSLLDPRIELFWIMAGKNVGDNLPGAVEGVQQVVWRRPINASNVIIKSAGHLIAQEAPEDLAQEVATFLQHAQNNNRSAKL